MQKTKLWTPGGAALALLGLAARLSLITASETELEKPGGHRPLVWEQLLNHRRLAERAGPDTHEARERIFFLSQSRHSAGSTFSPCLLYGSLGGRCSS